MVEAEGTVSKHLDARKGHYLTKFEGRAKGILIHRRPILAEWCVKCPADLERYCSPSIRHVLSGAYNIREGHTIEIYATID